MANPITIVGGGLSGLALGIGLRQRGVPVTVWEAGRYPRHRVCGEFISGDGQESLERLGVFEQLRESGSRPALSAAFYSSTGLITAQPLPKPALCISRHLLDLRLAWELVRLGGDLQTGARWAGEPGDGIVRASGRRAETSPGGARLFGLKVHARGIELEADLEMHLTPAGYVGLCRLAGGEVNVCGLFRSAVPVPDLSTQWRRWLEGGDGSVLRSRLTRAALASESFCTVAGLNLAPKRASGRGEICVGDALTMIPPVTGNGMSMALESAEIAVEPLAQFSRGELSWRETRSEIARRCDARFRRRLRWAGWLQKVLFAPCIPQALLRIASQSPWIWRSFFGRTR